MKRDLLKMTDLKSIVTDHAIERALEAEALVRELVEALEEAIWPLESYTGRHEDIMETGLKDFDYVVEILDK